MNHHSSIIKIVIVKVLIALSLPAFSQSFYVSGSIGRNYQNDTSNNGSFTSDFTTGTVTGVNPPLDIAAGSPVSWSTDYDDGNAFSLAIGMTMDNYRFEVEYAESDADVERHQGVNAAGIDLSTIDAGVLISGNVGDLGVSTADLVAAGRGELETSTLMLNAYYDFNLDLTLKPYIGVGIGNAKTELQFYPSGVGVINDDDNTFVYQLIVGASYSINQNLQAFANYRFRDADEASLDASLLPATFDINNESDLLDIGLRYAF